MLVFAPLPRDESETRTPITPAVVKKLVSAGIDVTLEPCLGLKSFIDDAEFADAGATFAGEGHHAWEDADVVVTVDPPRAEDVGRMREGGALVGLLTPTTEHDVVRAAVGRKVSLLALEFVPRTSRAQSMDVLSSQANLAGYQAVLLGASHCPKLMPMMITAAGTLSPARVLVVGVGVAGLQAIATAKRLGAIVEAYDVRPATKEQVLSLGARFIELPGSGAGETAGGYATEQSDEQRAQQAELMAKHVVSADVVITTAAVFGKAPPLLVPADVVARMKPGSVLVDLAANATHGRGNCELTRPGEITTTDNRVTLVGTTNLPGTLPVHASSVYANNVYALLETLIQQPDTGNDEGEEQLEDSDAASDSGGGSDSGSGPSLKIDLDDDIHLGVLITQGGQIVNDLVKGMVEQD
ncbi:MAG: NAD(P) transhydrogenase subunit alpha [Planctomycetota bacterium]